VLHVTNGDSVVNGFRAGNIPGTYLPWRDVLHDGAVPQCDSLEALSDIRARELTRLGFGAGADVDRMRAGFVERDTTLAASLDHDEVVLWFEHDLYDQLQLLQILDWFSRQDSSRVPVSIIQIGSHPDVVPFYGLGQLTGAQLAALFPTRMAVTRRQLEIGRAAWTAFCAPEPSALAPFAVRNDSDMPFLRDAIARFLEEYPSAHDGLSRSERQLLQAAVAGAGTRRELYAATTRMEPWPWSDLSVFLRIDGLAAGPRPALDRRGDAFAITDYGRRLLEGEPEAVLARTVDTWLGGVHLTTSPAR
jgi:hypothetical protein